MADWLKVWRTLCGLRRHNCLASSWNRQTLFRSLYFIKLISIVWHYNCFLTVDAPGMTAQRQRCLSSARVGISCATNGFFRNVFFASTDAARCEDYSLWEILNNDRHECKISSRKSINYMQYLLLSLPKRICINLSSVVVRRLRFVTNHRK